jgi:ABC-2 type transport system permease protein
MTDAGTLPTTATAPDVGTPEAQRPLPSTLGLGLSRAAVELKGFFREKDTLVFTFTLPIVILMILGSVFADLIEGTGITASQLFVGGMIAGGVASTSFLTLGAGIAADREDGTLKRLRGTPMPAVAYFLGKVVLVLVASLAELGILLGVGVFAFGLEVPTTPGRLFTLAWVFLLGVTACSLAGIAVSSLARSARGAGGLANLSLLVLMFASGVYVVPVSGLPAPLIAVGSLFPLKWMAQGMRSVFLPDVMARLEAAGAWEHGRTVLVLGAWCIGGLVLCLTTFRWRGRRER